MFIAINCASISLHLAESMLFGHKKGAFTGAIADAPGAFAEADGGTLFLDEIGELDLGLQAKLLRALETASIAPVGDVKERPVDVRVVAATNRNLPAEMRAGRFRADLYYRLAAFLIDIPELAARPGDLRALLLRCELSHRRAGEIELSPAARAALLEHRWPGNVRELRNVIERVMSLAKGPIVEAIDLQHLAPEVAQERRPRGSLEEMESEQIRRALEERGSVQEAADALGIHRSTLWRKLKRSRALSL
jgi:transcriptional regulator with PAS, ATPase and Fis domain